MNKNKVNFLLQAAGEDICVLIEKFLAAETFNIMDLCYWWDTSKEWWDNRKSAEIVIKVLAGQDCCIRIAGAGEFAYKKTSAFVGLLEQILRVETLLKEKEKEK